MGFQVHFYLAGNLPYQLALDEFLAQIITSLGVLQEHQILST